MGLDRDAPRMGGSRGLLVIRAGDSTLPFPFLTEGDMAKNTETKKTTEGDMAKAPRPEGTFPMWMYLDGKPLLVADEEQEATAIEAGLKETPE